MIVYVNREKSLFADKSPLPISPTSKQTFTFVFGTDTLVANDANLATRLINLSNGEDVSAASLTGSTTATGEDNRITSKALAGNLQAENSYVLVVEGTIDGELGSGKIQLNVQSEGVAQ